MTATTNYEDEHDRLGAINHCLDENLKLICLTLFYTILTDVEWKTMGFNVTVRWKVLCIFIENGILNIWNSLSDIIRK